MTSKLEQKVIDWFESAVNSDPQKIIDLYCHMNCGQIIKWESFPFELTIINEDNEITEIICWDKLIKELEYWVYEGYLDDVERIGEFANV